MNLSNTKKLLLSFTCFFFLISLILIYSNLHVHVLNNGLTVLHGHPFSHSRSQSPVNSHHHSTAEYLFLFCAAAVEGWLIFLFLPWLFFKTVDYLFRFVDDLFQTSYYNFAQLLRAPPAILF